MSDTPPSSKPLRPFSLRPEDLLEGDEKKKFEEERAEAVKRAEQQHADAPAPPPGLFGDLDEEPPASVGRASTHSRRPAPMDDDPASSVKPKEDHTILMAVPPPAQENTGK